jgi:hypothetical protein
MVEAARGPKLHPTSILEVLNLYVTVKSRCKKPNQRHWGIEQNEALQTYLGFYYGVDNVTTW